MPLGVYFIAGPVSMAVWGIAAFTRRLYRDLEFAPRFLARGGRAALQPLNDLIKTTWLLTTLPTLAIFVTITTWDRINYSAQGQSAPIVDTVFGVVMSVVAVLTIFTPQLFMNRLLAREKAREVRELREALASTADAPRNATSDEVVRRMLRHQHLAHELQQVERVVPSLIDARLIVQIGTSIVGVIAGNILLPELFAQAFGE